LFLPFINSWIWRKVMSALCSRLFLFAAALLVVTNVWAQEGIATVETTPTAHEVVAKVTEDTVAVIQQNKALLTENPSAYFAKVQAVLEPVVMFDFIAKTVMGNTYAKASAEQRKTFAVVFKQGMVETFAKGMANYSDFEINVLPPVGDQSNQRKIEVLQEVKGKEGTLMVSYTMASTKEGEWKLINVVLNGVNLGKSFRDQFTQAMRQHNGDIDKVIASWWQQDA
jgi:phospholipid transport system substrate-binding protein